MMKVDFRRLRRAVCCPEHYAVLTDKEKNEWEPIPDP
jgi:hypothetical protein